MLKKKVHIPYAAFAKAFTLVELLIVIAIIAVLTVAFLPALRGGTSKARDNAKRKLLADISTVFEDMVNQGQNLPSDTAQGNNTLYGQGVCLRDYSEPEASKIAQALGRVPQKFPSILPQPKNITPCVDSYVFYNRISSTPPNYFLVLQVENSSNANVEEGRSLGSLINRNHINNVFPEGVMQYTDQPVGTGDIETVPGSKQYYYVVAKGG